jgi:hypothetical protein
MTELNQAQTTESVEITKADSYDEDMKKYTKVDNLDEDTFSGYFLVSFISPEGIMNCNVRGLKIRTHKNKVVYQTLEEAQQAAEEINKKDNYFHVFVGETGKWMGWDPSPDDRTKVEKEVWANKDQNDIMQSLREKEEKKLQELNALVGKKKSLVDKDKKTHKKRVAKAIKAGLEGKETEAPVDAKLVDKLPEDATQLDDNDNENDNENEVEAEEAEVKSKSTAKKARPTVRDIKNRLRKKLEDKQQESATKLTHERLKTATNEATVSGEMKEKLDSNIKKLNDILQKAKSTQ